MPIYEYECKKCGQRFEIRRKFSDAPVKTCRQQGCSGRVFKVLSPPAIVFKGPGFYVNDYGRGNGNGKRKSERSEKGETDGDRKKEKAATPSEPSSD